MSSPNHSTSDLEDAFSSMNILNYTSVSSDYFPASSESSSFNSSENSKDNMIPPVFSSFYNNPYELHLHRIERMEEGRINSNKLKTKLKRITHSDYQTTKKGRQKDKIAFAHYRISDLEQIIEKIQARHQTDKEDL
ncbi:hypothetical protein Tco_1037435 [Tanacetum coccineum]